MSDEPLINKTGRAVTAISLMAFCISIIMWLIFYGVPANSLHQSALSWSYTLLVITAAALGLDTAVTTVLNLIKPKE